ALVCYVRGVPVNSCPYASEPLDFARIALAALLDSSGVQSGRISCEATSEALLFHEIPFGPRIGEIRQIARVRKRDCDIECIAPDPNIHRPLGASRHMLDGLIHYLAHTLNVIRWNLPLGGLLPKKVVERGRCQRRSVVPEAQFAVVPRSEQE